ncbi:hypothetical protein R3P38DRAFT_3504318 [Favolaschia claudopus]|uniref:Glucose-methanol-choline oxidoreductase N-terminal domain-containing protein n=1 Tax=Favolaschia claudopus TaxID=2862362 RepID=A0AAW0C469_9AGAR
MANDIPAKLSNALTAQRRRILWSSTAIATLLLLILRYAFLNRTRKQGKYIKKLSSVGSSGEGTVWESCEYDVIIVGGGTSGCVLAARLSEDPSIRVLLLEAGGGFTQLRSTPHVYDFTLEPQVHTTNRPRFFPEASLLKLSTPDMAQYGAPGDFDQWGALIGDETWSWNNLRRYFTKFEKYTGDPAYPAVDSSARGSTGPVRACGEVGIPLVPDFNGPNGPMGASRISKSNPDFLTYVDSKTRRVSSETAYLTREVLARPNLKVAIHAQVTRIIIDRVDGAPRAVGVEFANSPSGPRFRARARKEVIVSAGAIHSPHILMLSGIGPAAEPRKHSIPVVRDMPGVGANLVDHPVVSLFLKDKKNDSANVLKPKNVWQGLQLVREVVRYQLYGTGKLGSNFGEAAALRVSNASLSSTFQRTSKDHGRLLFKEAHIQLALLPASPHESRLRWPQISRSMGLTDNRSQLPAHPHDLEKLLRGFRLIIKIAHAKAMDAYLDHSNMNPELDHAIHRKTDDELRDIIRERVETVYHPTSTCRMAPEDQNGVVDSRLRVYGIQGLRVCDASVFPWIISGHTAGGCFAIAEKFADDLKAELGLEYKTSLAAQMDLYL